MLLMKERSFLYELRASLVYVKVGERCCPNVMCSVGENCYTETDQLINRKKKQKKKKHRIKNQIFVLELSVTYLFSLKPFP